MAHFEPDRNVRVYDWIAQRKRSPASSPNGRVLVYDDNLAHFLAQFGPLRKCLAHLAHFGPGPIEK